MRLWRSGAADGTADSTASGAASARRRRQSSFQLAIGAVRELLWPNALADFDRVFNSVHIVSWRARPVRPSVSDATLAAMKCSFVFLQNEPDQPCKRRRDTDYCNLYELCMYTLCLFCGSLAMLILYIDKRSRRTSWYM